MIATFKALTSCGASRDITVTAKTQNVKHELNKTQVDFDIDESVNIEIDKVDRLLDFLVKIGGSGWTFLIVSILLVGWIIGLIPTKGSVTWQSVISDVQAIFCYIYDSLLMRQQLQENEKSLAASGILRSRMLTFGRLSCQLKNDGDLFLNNNDIEEIYVKTLEESEKNNQLPFESVYDRVATMGANFIGSIPAITMYWLGIFIWLGFGHYCHWSNVWQMYINSATSALMIFIFVFLANIRERNKYFTKKCFNSIAKIDIEIEIMARSLTGDIIANEQVVIAEPTSEKIEKYIDIYAQLVGRLIGLLIIIIVLVVWISIGPAMHFNSNWFLISGTYAGLVGLFDGFVLRNAFARSFKHEQHEYEIVRMVDENVLAEMGFAIPEERTTYMSTSERIASKISNIFASKYTVLVGLVTIIGLVIASSALRWSVTGQLICNVPPSLIESFFMMVLITAHTISDKQRRDEISNISLRRRLIFRYFDKAIYNTLPSEKKNIAIGDN